MRIHSTEKETYIRPDLLFALSNSYTEAIYILPD